MKTIRQKISYALYMILVVVIAYMGICAYRAHDFYDMIKTMGRGWKGQVHQKDDRYGFLPIPDSEGFETFQVGADLPMAYDHHGFRIPLSHPRKYPVTKPLLLFIGDSFTYGFGCRAEETFPWLTGQATGMMSINAGVCSWGLAQMLLYARELIPRYQPDFVIVQYSFWLYDRAVDLYAPSFFGKVPSPYFTRKKFQFSIAPPPFTSVIYDLPINTYRYTKRGFGDFTAFFFRAGWPTLAHDDYFSARTKAGLWLNWIPEPSGDRAAVENYVYSEIFKLCRQNNSRMIFMILGNDLRSKQHEKAVEGIPRLTIINADYVLVSNLSPQTQEEYQRRYYIWKGNPPVIVDNHPSPQAHRIISGALSDYIAQNK